MLSSSLISAMAERSDHELRHPLPISVSGPHSKYCICPQVRKVKSRAAVVVIVWTYLVYTTFYSLIFEKFARIHLHAVPSSISQVSSIGAGIVAVLGPIAGLLASAHFGRYKMLYASFWLMWAGLIAIGIILVVLNWPWATQQSVAYSGVVIPEVVYFTGFAVYSVISVPFGLDQMPDASGEQITAFIHWYTWALLAAIPTAKLPVVINDCTSNEHSSHQISYSHTLQSFTCAFLMTLALCSVFMLHKWFVIEPKGINPLKTIFAVLRFASKHKIPVSRSAFTYWEPGKPSRIDLAKSKYGGPFTNEEVEDVKTCLRMVLVIASIGVTLSSLAGCISFITKTVSAMFEYKENFCQTHIVELGELFSIIVVLCLPVYDFFIAPIIRRLIPSMLKRAGLAQTLSIGVHLILLVMSTVWYMTNPSAQCIFTTDESFPLSVDYKWIAVTVDLIFFGCLFFFLTAILEFVCAQAPYNLKGLLQGLVFSVVLLSVYLGTIVFAIWKTGYEHNVGNIATSTCGVWFYLFTTITATLGCVLWCAVAKWYKRRERDEPDMCRIFAENYYDH